MPKPSPEKVGNFIRNLGLAACAKCGKAASGDPMATWAIYSCAIEDPRIGEYLCECRVPKPTPAQR